MSRDFLEDTLACFIFAGLLPIFILLMMTGGIFALTDYARSGRE